MVELALAIQENISRVEPTDKSDWEYSASQISYGGTV
jgi:uncharacterized protein YegJ (DUF2314 family)